MLLFRETDSLELLPNNLRVSFLVRNPQGDILYSVADATNWRDLPLVIDDRAHFFRQNMVGVMVLNPHQATALDKTEKPPLPMLLFHNGLQLLEQQTNIKYDVKLDIFIGPLNGCNALCDNPNYQAWRLVVATQLHPTCHQ